MLLITIYVLLFNAKPHHLRNGLQLLHWPCGPSQWPQNLKSSVRKCVFLKKWACWNSANVKTMLDCLKVNCTLYSSLWYWKKITWECCISGNFTVCMISMSGFIFIFCVSSSARECISSLCASLFYISTKRCSIFCYFYF